MMYNRYIPSSNGVYKRHSVCVPDLDEKDSEPHINAAQCEPEPVVCAQTTAHGYSNGLDLGDLLLLCIVILILMESEDDYLPIIIAAAAYLLIQ